MISMKKNRQGRSWKRLLALLLSVSLVVPFPVLAEEASLDNGQYMVEVKEALTDNAPGQSLSELEITDLEEPEAGEAFDLTALVTSAEQVSWEIPVFWVDVQSKVAEMAKEGETYLPVLAFFLPEGYALAKTEGEAQGGMVRLPKFLTEIFESTGGVLSIFDPDTGITYITGKKVDQSVLPFKVSSHTASGEEKMPSRPIDGFENIPDLAYGNPPTPVPQPACETVTEIPTEITTEGGTEVPVIVPTETESVTESVTMTEDAPEITTEAGTETTTESGSENPQDIPELIRIHCSQTAMEAISPDQLEWFVSLIRYTLQPQAVNLLQDRIPAFAQAEESELGSRISLYVYYEKGDEDTPGHSRLPEGAMAYVGGTMEVYDENQNEIQDEGESFEYAYMIGVDASVFFVRNEEGEIIFDDTAVNRENLSNTIVHEMFHAFMYDYNRAGMLGLTNEVLDTVESLTPEQIRLIMTKLRFPSWFIEGTALCVENNYQYRQQYYDLLRYSVQDQVLLDKYDPETLLALYRTHEWNIPGNDSIHLDYGLEYADSNSAETERNTSRYVTGYLASLYLSEMAARTCLGESAQYLDNGTAAFDSSKIRAGFSQILEKLHEGQTLDSIIQEISQGVYANTSEFTTRFVQGEDGSGDEGSLNFCVDFLNYMLAVTTERGQEGNAANGSILFDFDRDFTSPLDWNLEGVESDLYQILDYNDYVFSSVLQSQSGTGTNSELLWEFDGTLENNPEEADLPESVAAREEGDLEWTFEDDAANVDSNEGGWEEDGFKEETGGEESSEDEDYDEASEEIAEVYAGESCEEESDYVK